jgi:hypothetical protein
MRCHVFNGGAKMLPRPLKNVLSTVVLLPHLGRAVAIQDEDNLLVEVPLRLQRRAGRDLHDVHPARALHQRIEVEKDGVPPDAGPGRDVQRPHVHANGEVLEYFDALVRDPLAVRRAVKHGLDRRSVVLLDSHAVLPINSTVHGRRAPVARQSMPACLCAQLFARSAPGSHGTTVHVSSDEPSVTLSARVERDNIGMTTRR